MCFDRIHRACARIVQMTKDSPAAALRLGREAPIVFVCWFGSALMLSVARAVTPSRPYRFCLSLNWLNALYNVCVYCVCVCIWFVWLFLAPIINVRTTCKRLCLVASLSLSPPSSSAEDSTSQLVIYNYVECLLHCIACVYYHNLVTGMGGGWHHVKEYTNILASQTRTRPVARSHCRIIPN